MLERVPWRDRDLGRSARAVLCVVLAYASLLKLKIVALLLFVSLVTAILAARATGSAAPLGLLLLTGAMAAGGAGALNMYLERDLDECMVRTRRRGLILARVGGPRAALASGLALVVGAVGVALLFNGWLAFFLCLGAFVYVVVYTLWLKRRSAWNVVVGGLAGSCAALAGWAAVGPWWSAQPLLLAALVFFWTPPHFWSLASDRGDDYRRAGVPMLPVVVGPRLAALAGLGHIIAVVLVSLALAAVGGFGAPYLGVALAGGGLLVVTAVWLAGVPHASVARLHFRVSTLYLGAVFASMLLDVYLRG